MPEGFSLALSGDAASRKREEIQTLVGRATAVHYARAEKRAAVYSNKLNTLRNRRR